MPHVLIVDDEDAILTLVSYNMERAGFTTSVVKDGLVAWNQLIQSADSYDLIVLDIMLPGIDGLELCKRLRQQGITTPVILLTARDDEVDRVVGLEIGADDYVTKPFSPRELVARARAVLRRGPVQTETDTLKQAQAEEMLNVGAIQMHLAKHEVLVRGQTVELTPKEFELLQYFMENPQRVLSRDQLLDHVWGYSAVRDTRIVDVHVSHLREKLEADVRHPQCIRTVRGIGYKLTGFQGR